MISNGLQRVRPAASFGLACLLIAVPVHASAQQIAATDATAQRTDAFATCTLQQREPLTALTLNGAAVEGIGELAPVAAVSGVYFIGRHIQIADRPTLYDQAAGRMRETPPVGSVGIVFAQGGEATEIPLPPGARPVSWQPLAAAAHGDSLHVLWRDSSAGTLNHALYAERSWRASPVLRERDSLLILPTSHNPMAADADGAYIVATRRVRARNTLKIWQWGVLQFGAEGNRWTAIDRAPDAVVNAELVREAGGLSLIALAVGPRGASVYTSYRPRGAAAFPRAKSVFESGHWQFGDVRVVGASNVTVASLPLYAGQHSAAGSQKVHVAVTTAAGDLVAVDTLLMGPKAIVHAASGFGPSNAAVSFLRSEERTELFLSRVSVAGPTPRIVWDSLRVDAPLLNSYVVRHRGEVWLYGYAPAQRAQQFAAFVRPGAVLVARMGCSDDR